MQATECTDLKRKITGNENCRSNAKRKAFRFGLLKRQSRPPEPPGSKKPFSADILKLIAVCAMLADHAAWLFLPFDAPAGQSVHFFGRIAAPVTCFLLVEGYFHTRSVKRYAVRLGVFALISQIPYSIFQTGTIDFRPGPGRFSVLYTLLCCLLAVWVWDKMRDKAFCSFALAALSLLSVLGDWMMFAFLFTMVFAINRGNLRKQCLWFAAAAVFMTGLMTASSMLDGNPFYSQLYQLGVLLSIPCLGLYNGRRAATARGKWIFYVFYPAHLLALILLKQAVS